MNFIVTFNFYLLLQPTAKRNVIFSKFWQLNRIYFQTHWERHAFFFLMPSNRSCKLSNAAVCYVLPVETTWCWHPNTYTHKHNRPLQLFSQELVIELVSHTTYVVCVNFINKWLTGTYSLKSTPNDRFFKKLFMAILFTLLFCHKSAERTSPKKYFLDFRF